MTDTMKNTAISSKTDSLFGMALAQAFMGVAWGPGAYIALEAGETALEVYDDRRADIRTNGPDQTFKLGVKDKKLTGAFAGVSSPSAPETALDWTPRVSADTHTISLPSCNP